MTWGEWIGEEAMNAMPMPMPMTTSTMPTGMMGMPINGTMGMPMGTMPMGMGMGMPMGGMPMGMMGMPGMGMPMMMPMMMPMTCRTTVQMEKDGMVCRMTPMDPSQMDAMRDRCNAMTAMMTMGMPMMMMCGAMPMMMGTMMAR